jgi:hypothetical protein
MPRAWNFEVMQRGWNLYAWISCVEMDQQIENLLPSPYKIKHLNGSRRHKVFPELLVRLHSESFVCI